MPNRRGKRPPPERAAPHRIAFLKIQFANGLRYTQVRDLVAATFGVTTRTAEFDIKRYYAMETESLEREIPNALTRAMGVFWRAIAVAERQGDAPGMVKAAEAALNAVGLAKARKLKIEVEGMKTLTEDDLLKIVETERAALRQELAKELGEE